VSGRRARDAGGGAPHRCRVITLANCPFHALAEDYTELVCGMNLDLLHGLVEGLESAELEARLEPAPGRCCVVLERPNAPGER